MRRILATLLLCSLVPAAAAKPMQFGGVAFDLPKGWKVQESSDNIMLQRTWEATEDADAMSALIQIVPLANTAPGSLEANMRGMVETLPELAEEDPMLDSAGITANGYQIRSEYRCCDHSRDVSIGQSVVAIADTDKQVVAALAIINTRSDHEDAADADFEALVRSLRFEGDEAAGLTPAEGDGGLDGVFTHLATGLMPNAFGGLDFTVDNEIAYFEPGGLMSDTIPATDLAEHCQTTPTDCGTYRVTGGWFAPSQIEMRRVVNGFGTIEVETLPLTKKGDDIALGEEDYYRLPPFEVGKTFDGTWTYSWASSGMTATGSGGIAVERTLVMHPDGSFTRDGWSGGSTSGEAGGVSVSSDSPAASGTYAVSGYSITFSGNDGSSETVSIFAPDRDDEDLLVIGGSNYLKDD